MIAGIPNSSTRLTNRKTSFSTTSSRSLSWTSILVETSWNTSPACLGGAKSALATTATISASLRFNFTGKLSRSRAPLCSTCTNSFSIAANFSFRGIAALATASAEEWDSALCSHSSTWRRMLRSLLIESWVSDNLFRMLMCRSNWESKSAWLATTRGSLTI